MWNNGEVNQKKDLYVGYLDAMSQWRQDAVFVNMVIV